LNGGRVKVSAGTREWRRRRAGGERSAA
jgi:hypothetical protein